MRVWMNKYTAVLAVNYWRKYEDGPGWGFAFFEYHDSISRLWIRVCKVEWHDWEDLGEL